MATKDAHLSFGVCISCVGMADLSLQPLQRSNWYPVAQSPHHKSHCLCRLPDMAQSHSHQEEYFKGEQVISQELAQGQTSQGVDNPDLLQVSPCQQNSERTQSLISFPRWVRLGEERGQERSWSGWATAGRRKLLTQTCDCISLRED